MKTEKEWEEFLDSLQIPTDKEVEAAGMRFDRRLRKLQLWRRVLWSSGVAAVVLSGLLITLLFVGRGEEGIPEFAATREMPGDILVPTLIMADGGRVNLQEKNTTLLVEKHANIRIEGNHLVYDAQSDTVALKINTLVIPSGYIYRLTLSDGTAITLNAGSRLEYPETFTGNRREVRLCGEAYFQVAKSEKPFEVYTGEAKVRVYGTQFNVKTGQGNITETVLVEGKVGFIPAVGEEVRIKPGQEVAYDKQSGHMEVRSVDVTYATAWMDGVFKYRDRPLRFVLEDMAAWYGVKFDLQKQEAVELTMILEKSTPLKETLEFIEQITDCKIKEERGVYIVK